MDLEQLTPRTPGSDAVARWRAAMPDVDVTDAAWSVCAVLEGCDPHEVLGEVMWVLGRFAARVRPVDPDGVWEDTLRRLFRAAEGAFSQEARAELVADLAVCAAAGGTPLSFRAIEARLERHSALEVVVAAVEGCLLLAESLRAVHGCRLAEALEEILSGEVTGMQLHVADELP